MNSGMRIDPRCLPISMQEQVAMHYLAQQGGMVPAVPGHENGYDIAEMSFRNGEAHRTEQIVEILLDRKTRVKGEVHRELVELIEIVRGLC